MYFFTDWDKYLGISLSKKMIFDWVSFTWKKTRHTIEHIKEMVRGGKSIVIKNWELDFA